MKNGARNIGKGKRTPVSNVRVQQAAAEDIERQNASGEKGKTGMPVNISQAEESVRPIAKKHLSAASVPGTLDAAQAILQ